MAETQLTIHLGKTTKKKDFVEIEFLGKNLTNNEVFDTNILEEAKKLNPNVKEVKPFIASVGEGFVVKGFDEALEGKEIGKKYKIILSPEQAFGNRRSDLVKMIPMKFFMAQKVYPQPGMTLALDNNLVKIISVSGGRVLSDFNNPLAGKDVEFEFTIKKIVTDTREKVNAIQTFFFGREFEFDVDEKNKKIVFKEIQLTPILNAFRSKFKDLVGFDVEILEKKKEAAEEKKEVESEKTEDNPTKQE